MNTITNVRRYYAQGEGGISTFVCARIRTDHFVAEVMTDCHHALNTEEINYLSYDLYRCFVDDTMDFATTKQIREMIDKAVLEAKPIKVSFNQLYKRWKFYND